MAGQEVRGRRARTAGLFRAGVAFLAVTGSVLFVAPAPAQAAAPKLSNVVLSNSSLTTGQTAQLKYTVKGDDDDTAVSVTIGQADGVTCSGDCSPSLTGEGTFTATITAGTVAAGQTKNVALKLTATSKGLLGGDEVTTQTLNLEIKGPAAVQTVKKISGTVVDNKTGAGISGASVAIQDGGGHRYDTATNGRGTFTFNGTTDKPITPGSINMVVVAKNFENGAQTINGANNATVSEVSFKLASTTAPSPSATPSASESAEPSESPSAEASEAGGETTPEATDEAAETDNAANSTDDDSGIPWAVILIGALLVAIGVGTMVLLFIRRKQDKEADAAAVSEYRERGPGAAGGAYGATNDATRIGGAGMGAGGIGAGGMDDATRITNPLADAPTMITSRAAMDEFPDPYGAPPPGAPGAPKWAGSEDNYGAGGDATRAGYGDDRGGYGSAGSASVSGAGYGDADNHGAGGYDRGGYGSAGSASVSGSGYGAGGRGDYGGAGSGSVSGGGGYGAGNDPYEEPTGRYNGGGDGYGGQGGGYGANPAGPYGQRADQGGYGAQEIDYGTQGQGGGAGYGGGQGGYGGGAGAQGGYGGRGDEYGSGAAGGYGGTGGQGGYGGAGGQGGYGGANGQGGYGDRAGYDQGGYDQQGGGYDQAGAGYGADQSGYPAQQGGDRSGYDQSGDRSDNRGGNQRGDRRIDWMDD
ncbi:hypothetical protein ACIA8K_14435 [Catenuloplanes sp. NPDC051500]|uniref:hypothetical protein n=1 Tax=Catenuloplanes sp. NPDC051500 TaxID=3363959 RepID=UPI0037A596AA